MTRQGTQRYHLKANTRSRHQPVALFPTMEIWRAHNLYILQSTIDVELDPLDAQLVEHPLVVRTPYPEVQVWGSTSLIQRVHCRELVNVALFVGVRKAIADFVESTDICFNVWSAELCHDLLRTL